MSRTIEDIGRALRELVRQEQSYIMPAKVKSVDNEGLTCTVEFEGLELEARLTAVIDSSGNRSAILPKQDSWVLVAPIGGDETDLFVTAYSEIESITLNGDTLK